MKKSNKLQLIVLSIFLCLSLTIACQPTSPIKEDVTELELNDEEVNEKDSKEKVIVENNNETSEDENNEEISEVGEIEGTKETKENNSNVLDIPKIEESEAPKNNDTSITTMPNNDLAIQIEGIGVEKEINLSLDDLKAMTDSYFEDDFYSLNSYGTREHFHFKGVKVKAILDKAGLKSNASKVYFAASDGYTQELSIEGALKEDYIDQDNPEKKFPVIIAWHENGKDYDIKKGAPFRLVVGQKEPDDMNKPQWVSNIAKIIVD